MAKIGKKHKKALDSFDKIKNYEIQDAIQIVKDTAKANFDETVDVSIKVNLKRGQSLRDTMVLPHSSTTIEKKIMVFAQGEQATQATEAGATYVGDTEYIEKIREGWMDFDVVIATPDMMKDMGKLGPILGRRGLMPNPKTKTVTTDVASAIKELQQGRIELRADRTGVVHVSIGKVSMDSNHLSENVKKIITEVKSKKPSESKGDFLLSITVSSTMGPGVRVLNQVS